MKSIQNTKVIGWSIICLGLLVTATAAGRLRAQEQAGPSGATRAVIENCLVSLIDDVKVPANEAGVLLEMAVRPGQFVEKDALLGRVDDRVAVEAKRQASIEYRAAYVAADNDINVRAAVAAAEVAQAEYDTAVAANRITPDAIARAEVRRRLLAAKHAKLQIEQSNLEQKLAKYSVESRKSELIAADEAVKRHHITAPVQGVVDEVYRHAGEWVQPGEPVLRLMRVDRLRVEGFLSTTHVSPIDVLDRPVVIEAQLSGGRTARFTGKVVYVSQIAQAGLQYRVWAEIDNRKERGHWLLRPGLPARMTVR